ARVAWRHEQPRLARAHQLGHALDRSGHDRSLARERLADAARDAEPRPRRVGDDVGGAEDRRHVVAMAERGHAVAETGGARAVGDLGHARRRRADEEQARARLARGDLAHGRHQLPPAAPGADADLRDESIVPAEAELAPDGPAVHAGMEALEVGAGVNDLDLAGGDAAGDEAALDRLG